MLPFLHDKIQVHFMDSTLMINRQTVASLSIETVHLSLNLYVYATWMPNIGNKFQINWFCNLHAPPISFSSITLSFMIKSIKYFKIWNLNYFWVQIRNWTQIPNSVVANFARASNLVFINPRFNWNQFWLNSVNFLASNAMQQ